MLTRMAHAVRTAWRRSRRGGFGALVAVSVLAVVATATVGAVPAEADQYPAPSAPYVVTTPSGDLVATVDVAGVAPATESDFLNTEWPESIGLSANPSLSDLLQGEWQYYSGAWANNPDGGTPNRPASAAAR
jgi:hypothetical protein